MRGGSSAEGPADGGSKGADSAAGIFLLEAVLTGAGSGDFLGKFTF